MIIKELLVRYPVLESARPDIEAAFELLRKCYEKGGKLLVAGNGGSMADSQHIVGELMKRFSTKRPIDAGLEVALGRFGEDGKYLCGVLEGALPAIALDAAPLTSAVINDSGCGDIAFAQMIVGLGNEGDAFWGVTTSGNSRNVCLAAKVARAKGMKILGLTGSSGGELKGLSDVCVCVPETETYRIQELHVPVYHALCRMLEEHFFA